MQPSVAAQCCGLVQPTYPQVIDFIAVQLRVTVSLYITYIVRRLGRDELFIILKFPHAANSKTVEIREII